MLRIDNIDKFTGYWKQQYPSLYKNKSDEEIFSLVSKKYPDLGVPSYSEALQTHQGEIEESTINKESLDAEKTDPAWVDSFFLTSDFIPEKWQQEGTLGGLISSDFFRQAYNNSMAGMLYKTAHGKEKWDVSESYDPSWYAQAGQFAVGMASPLDMATMASTGYLGKGATVAARAGIFGRGAGKKFLEKGLLSNFAAKHSTFGAGLARTVDGALSLGVGGGSFAASHAFVGETARQRIENPDKPVNISKALKVASDEFLHAAPMFAIAGGVTQGIMGSLYGYSTAYAGKNASYAAKLTQAATHPLARVGTEAALFTSLPSVLGDEDAPKLGTKEWWAGLGTNALIVGGMRAIGGFTENKYIDAFEFVKTEMKLENAGTKKIVDAHKTIVESLGDAAPAESRKIVRDYAIAEGNLKVDLAQAKKEFSFIKEVNRKLEDPEYRKKSRIDGSKENVEVGEWARLSKEYSTGTNGAIDSLLTDPTRIREHLKDKLKREPTDTELKKFELNLKEWKETTEKNIEWVDDVLGGNWRQSPDGINGGDPGVPPTPARRTTIGGMTREEAKASGGISDKAIVSQGKKLGVEVTKEKGVIQNREQVIDRIYNQEKAQYEASLALTQAGAPQIGTAGGIGAKVDVSEVMSIVKKDGLLAYDTIEYQRISSKKKKDRTGIENKYIDNANKINQILASNLKNDVNKNLLAYSSEKSAVRPTKKATEEAINLLEFVEKNYKKSIDLLTDAQKQNLMRDYMNNYFGVEVIRKSYKLANDKALRTKLNNDLTKVGLVKSEFNRLLNHLKEHFHQGEFPNTIGYNLMFPANKGVPAAMGTGKQIKLHVLTGQKEITIAGGFEGLAKLASFVKNSKDFKSNGIKVGNKVVSAKEASLIMELANIGFLRPTEIPLIKVMEIDVANGLVKVTGKKTMRNVSVGKELAQKLKDFADNNNLKPGDNLFKVGDVKGLNALMKKVFEAAPQQLKPEIIDTFTLERHAFDKNIKLSSVTLPSGKNLGGGSVTAGVQASSLFRRLFDLKQKGMSEADIAALLGQSSTISQKSYLKAGAPKPLPKQKRTTRLESEKRFESITDTSVKQKAREKFITKFAKKNNLSESQLKEAILGKGVFGEWVDAADGAIRLQKGIWEPSDFFHENTHRLKSFARETNNKSLMKLIERGESLAKQTKEYKEWKKKNVNRDVEEFLADIAGGKASKMEFSPGLLKKVTQFVKQMVSRIKVAFGAGNFNDYANIVAKKVHKGFSTKGVEFTRNQVKYSMEGMTPEAALKFAKRNIDELFEQNKITVNKKAIIRHIGELAELGENFKLSSKTTIPELEQFVAHLNSISPEVRRRLPNKLEWWENFKDAEKIRLIKNITEADRTSILKDLEVLDGKINNASSKQLQHFIEIAQTMGDVKKSTTSWIDKRVAEGMLEKSMGDKFHKIRYAKGIMPISTVLEYVGLKKLANRLYNHTHTELGYIGKFSEFEFRMKGKFGNKKWEKVKEMAYLFDKERYFERLEKGYLKTVEKQFINKAFDVNVKERTMTVKSGKEGDFVKAHRKLMRDYKEALIGEEGALREVLNKAEFEKFMNDKNINWINEKNNVYVQRRLTKEFKKYYDPQGNHFKKLVEEQTDVIANKMARKYFKKEGIENPTKEQIAKKMSEFHEDAISMAHGELYELFEFNVSKYSPSFLKERHSKLPEKIKLDGKMVDVYETSFGLTTKDYAINQAKFLANVEYFPEFVKLKGFNRPGAKELLVQLQTKDPTLAKWVDERIKEHLNIDKRHSDYPDGIRALRYTTTLAAKFQLSSPASGLKNFVIGSSQSMLAYRLRDFLGGFADAIHRDNRAWVTGTGATEIGLRSIELKGIGGALQKIAEKGFFRFGLMKPTENLNRYVSVLAGKRDQLHLTKRIQHSKEGSRSYRNAETKLRDFYKLSTSDIALLKEFGMNGVQGLSGKVAGINKRALDKLYQKMNTFAHINTQGAALNLFMPDWSGSPLAQSALLYKRMAYAATVNTARSLNIARKNKSLLQPLLWLGGTWLSGEVLFQFYEKLLGQSMPKENSDEWNILNTTMWKGEFLGILSDFLNPYGTEHVGMTMYPSLLSTAGLLFGNIGSMVMGDKFVSQGVHDMTKGSIGIWNAVHKAWKQGFLAEDSYQSQAKRYRKLYNDMNEEYGNRDEIIGVNKTEMDFQMSPYMRAFKENFESGYDKDLGKWYMACLFSKANDYYYSRITENGTPIKSHGEALQAAVKSMKQSLTSMNPNKAKVTAKTRKGAISQLKKADMFIQYLDRTQPLSEGLIKLENQYGARVRLLSKSLDKYLKGANLEKDLKHYGIKFGDLLFK